MKELIKASREHEKQFRETYQLKPEFRGNPECESAFEYAATYKLNLFEIDYVGEIIEDKLKQLGVYAEELEKEEPLDLLNYYINQITEELDNFPDYQTNLGNDFRNDVVKVINNYTSKDLITPLVSYQLLCVLVSYVKKSMIENKADSLGIERNLYKQEMKFLFKGKWK